MKISIITISYNSSATISATIESILNQTYSNIEYIIIDGDSQDNTIEIAKMYQNKFYEKHIPYIIISEPDNGIYDAMNKGIILSTGDIISILNSDDQFAHKTVLQSIANIMTKNNIDTCYGNLMYYKNNRPYRIWKSGKERTFRYGWMPPHPAFFVKKVIYLKYGTFRLDCGINADYEIMLRFIEKKHVSTAWINKTIVIMNQGGLSNKGINSRKQGIKDNIRACKLNNIKYYYITILLKKIRKIPQYISAIDYNWGNKI